jgi:hypothetical protein
MQCFDTLTETIQGPCQDNQIVVIDSKFLDIAYQLLQKESKSTRRPGTTREDTSVFPKKLSSLRNLSTGNKPAPAEQQEVTKWMLERLKYKVSRYQFMIPLILLFIVHDPCHEFA